MKKGDKIQVFVNGVIKLDSVIEDIEGCDCCCWEKLSETAKGPCTFEVYTKEGTIQLPNKKQKL